MSNLSTLQTANQNRKARLAHLRSLQRKPDPPQEPQIIDNEPTSRKRKTPPRSRSPELTSSYTSGRNYDIETRGPKLGFESQPSASQVTLETQAKALADDSKKRQREEVENGDQPVDLFKLQPKKPTWDLKRHLDKKLEILGVRTDNAIARMVKDKVQKARKEAATRFSTTNGQGETEEFGKDIGFDGPSLVEATRELERADTHSHNETNSSEEEDEG